MTFLAADKAKALRDARIAFVNWFQERIGFTPWNAIARMHGMNKGNFHEFMACKRSLTREQWARMTTPDGYFGRRWDSETMQRGESLFRNTHRSQMGKTKSKPFVDPRPALLKLVDDYEKATDATSREWIGMELREAISNM